MLNFYRPVDYIGLILNPVIFLALLTYVIVDLPQAGSIVEKFIYTYHILIVLLWIPLPCGYSGFDFEISNIEY